MNPVTKGQYAIKNTLQRLNLPLGVQSNPWGCIGFDVGSDAWRRMPSPLDARKSPDKKLTANDSRYALAA